MIDMSRDDVKSSELLYLY